MAVALGVAPEPAAADKFHDLSHALIHGKTEKARISAAVSLGRMRDRRAMKPLVRALADRSNVVRALAVSGLGHLEDPAALPALVRAQKDPDPTVKRRAAEAIAAIRAARTPKGGPPLARRARGRDRLAHYAIAPRERRLAGQPEVFVVLKSALDKSEGRAAPRARALRAHQMRSLIVNELRRDEQVTLLSSVAVELGIEPYSVDVSILKMGRSERGPFIEIECQLRVAVSNQRGKMLSVMTGGAKVQVPRRTFRAQYERQFQKEAMENAVKSVHQDLIKYLRSRPS
jgi:hypothetical protein